MTITETTVRVLAPAIRVDGVIYISMGSKTHQDAIQSACLAGAKVHSRQEGFTNTRREFLTRKEAFKLARDKGQISKHCTGPLLYSTDVKAWGE